MKQCKIDEKSKLSKGKRIGYRMMVWLLTVAGKTIEALIWIKRRVSDVTHGKADFVLVSVSDFHHYTLKDGYSVTVHNQDDDDHPPFKVVWSKQPFRKAKIQILLNPWKMSEN